MIRKLAALAFAIAFTLPALALAATPVNVNKADAATIAKALDGIGITKARAIVTYRKAHGPFKSVQDLGRVKGIGKGTLAHNKGDIRLTGSPAKATAASHKHAKR